MSADFLTGIFEHNNWANLKIIEACSSLTDEQLDAEPHTATKGSIRDTLVHMVSAQRGYLALLMLPREQRPTEPLAFSDLEKSIRASGEALLSLAKGEQQLQEAPLQTRDDYYVQPWVVMVQAINHATEHREQIKSMLSALSITPPDIDGWDYGLVTHALIPISK